MKINIVAVTSKIHNFVQMIVFLNMLILNKNVGTVC